MINLNQLGLLVAFLIIAVFCLLMVSVLYCFSECENRSLKMKVYRNEEVRKQIISQYEDMMREKDQQVIQLYNELYEKKQTEKENIV